MDNLEKVIDRINKLLALSGNNPSKEEAQRAMLKAQELMAQYNVELSQLNKKEAIQYSMEICDAPGQNGYRCTLGTIIARNFCCKVIMLHGNVAFIGHITDAKIAKQVFEYAYKYARLMGHREEATCRKEGRPTAGAFKSYTSGFCLGLKQALDAQCQALMIVVPPDVDEEFKNRFPSVVKYSGGAKRNTNNFYSDSFQNGVTDGKHVMDKRSIEG